MFEKYPLLNKWKNVLKVKYPVSYKLLVTNILPIVIATTHGIYSYASKDTNSRSLENFTTPFGLTYVFVFGIVTQLIRAQKEIDDKLNFSSIQTSLSELRNSVNGLEKLGAQIPTSNVSVTDNGMLRTAKRAVADGYILPGLMLAGVAFEQAIILKINRLGILPDKKTTPSQLLSLLKNYYQQNTINEFYAVWKLRNQLVHLSPDATAELENSPHLLKYFEWAIEQLENE